MTHSKSKIEIAVVGMDCVFPQAENAGAFWKNIINRVNAIGDPLPSWQSDVHLKRRGETSTDQGGYLKDLFRIEPAKFGIMPKALDGGEPDQFIALEIAHRALADAGARYIDPSYEHRDTGIIVGHSPYYHRGQVNTAQHHVFIEQMRNMLLALKPDLSTDKIAEFEALLRNQLPPFVPDISPGLVPNVLTGRIANRLNLRGPNYMIDAACASSLLAVQSAIDELQRGSSRMMLVGGVNASLPAEVAIIFTQLGALSDSGKVRPFSATADGTLLGEGAGFVVLKRLEDALEDGDRIYSVIRGVGQSSDGRGLGLLSPSKDGEVLAMRRAYQEADLDPSTVSLIEAHGTGIPLGDRTEIEALEEIFGARELAEGKVAIGSVKSMISHCIPAAGIAGLIKTSMALYHRILPPSLCDEIKPELGIESTNLYVNTQPRPWIHETDAPRRAGVNSFGFGGVNAHLIVEEPPATAPRDAAKTPWSHELFVFAASDVAGLTSQLDRVAAFGDARLDCGLGDIAYTCQVNALADGGPVRLSIVAKDQADLSKKIAQAKKKLAKSHDRFALRNGVAFRNMPLDGKVAFMFAGEGSQYLGMFEDLACLFDPLRQWLDFWHESSAGTGEANRVDIFYPRASELTDAKRATLQSEIYGMSVGSEAAFLGGQAMHGLLTSLNVKPDAMVGHSTGESGALMASGIVKVGSRQEMLAGFREITAISRDINESGKVPRGALLAVGLLDRAEVGTAIAPTEAMIAMENCPNQTIVFAPGDCGDAVQKILTDLGAVVEKLPFDRGYHTPGFKPMQDAFETFYERTGVKASTIPLYSCATAAPFGTKPKDIISLAGQQWTQSVRFVDTIKAMFDDGVRTFVEVAPGGKLSSFAKQILDEAAPHEDVMIAASNVETKSGLETLLHLLGQLFTCGQYDPIAVFSGREVASVDLAQLTVPKRKGVLINNSIPRIEATPEVVAFLAEIGITQDSVPLPCTTAGVTTTIIPSEYSLIKQAHRVGNDRLEADLSFEIASTLFLQDHELSGPVSAENGIPGMSCVPFMVSLEAMAEAGALLLARRDIGLVENMTGEGWIWADRDTTTFKAIARRVNDTRVDTEIWVHGKRAVAATITFGPVTPESPALPEIEPGHLYNWPERFEMYRENIFHGPLFQTIDTVTAWSPQGIEAMLSNCDLNGFVDEGMSPDFILNPALFDAFTQITAFWLAQDRGPYFASFPRKIDRIELFDAPAAAANDLWVRTAQVAPPVAGSDGTWATDCFAGERLVVRLSGMQNAFSDLPPAYYPYSLEPINGWLGAPSTYDAAQNIVVWDMPTLDDTFWRCIGGVFHRVLAFSTLTVEEREVWHTMSDTPAAREAYLMPRVALKEAIRWWVATVTGERLYAADFDVFEIGQNQWGTSVSLPDLHLVLTTTQNPSGLRVTMQAHAAQVASSPYIAEEMETQW